MKFIKKKIFHLTKIIKFNFREKLKTKILTNIKLNNSLQKQKTYVLYLKKNKNNFFLTLTDNTNKVITKYTLKSGNLKKWFNNKKKRRSGDALEALINKFIKILKDKNINKLHKIKLETKNKNLNKKLTWLLRTKTKIGHVIWVQKTPHNGMKERKKKRK